MCPRRKLRLLSWLLWAGLASPLDAAELVSNAIGGSAYGITHWTAENGLPENKIQALLQARNGYIWIGTLYGLARFDGVRFTIFDHSNTPEMSNDAIVGLAEDKVADTLWVQTAGELLRYEGHHFVREPGFPGSGQRLWPANQGGFWFVPRAGQLGLFRNGQAKVWDLFSEGWYHSINQLREDGPSALLVMQFTGLFVFNPVNGSVTPFAQPPEGTMTFDFLTDKDGSLLVTSDHGMWSLAGTNWSQLEVAYPDKGLRPSVIFKTPDGQLWTMWKDSNHSRLAHFIDRKSVFIELERILGEAIIDELMADREGNLWAVTYHGLYRIRPKAVRVYSRSEGLRNDDIQLVTAGSDGTIWLGTKQGISGIKQDQVFNLPAGSARGLAMGDGILNDGSGRLWTRSEANGMSFYEHGSWRAATRLQSQDDLGLFRGLFADREGRFWLAFQGGVRCLDRDGEVLFCATTQLSHPDVRFVHQDRQGDMWFGTFGGGLNRLHAGKINSYTTTKGDYNNRAWHIHEDKDGIFWVGSQNGLNRFVPPGHELAAPGSGKKLRIPDASNERFFTFTTQHGLRENVVNNIQEDDFGSLWLSGLHGIYRVSREELNKVAAGEKPEVQCVAYGEADGMLSSECNGGDDQPAGCKDAEGRIWFPTTKGVVVIDPRSIRQNDVLPLAVIETVVIDDEIVFGDRLTETIEEGSVSPHGARIGEHAGSPETELHLGPGRARGLQIRYTGNSFVAPERMRFKFRLEGFDRNWREADGSERTAFYTNLRPRKYSFRVRACNNHGYWSVNDAVFAFSVAQHFYETWPFYVVCGLGVVGLAAAVQSYRLEWQRRVLKLEQASALATERARIARDLHDDLGTALTGLALEAEIGRQEQAEPSWLRFRLGEVAARSRSLADRMREVVWAISPRCDTIESLAGFLCQHTEQFTSAAGLRCRLHLPDHPEGISLHSLARHQLFLAVKEALTNVVKHARATCVELRIEVVAGTLRVVIGDDGCGLNGENESGEVGNPKSPNGHGLNNMRERLSALGGEFRLEPNGERGTRVVFIIPLAGQPKPGSVEL